MINESRSICISSAVLTRPIRRRVMSKYTQPVWMAKLTQKFFFCHEAFSPLPWMKTRYWSVFGSLFFYEAKASSFPLSHIIPRQSNVLMNSQKKIDGSFTELVGLYWHPKKEDIWRVKNLILHFTLSRKFSNLSLTVPFYSLPNKIS